MTGPNRRELTRISIVDEQLRVVLDTLVKPKNAVTNYLTQYSGITEKMLRTAETTLSDVQGLVRRLLPKDAILCGHSLQHDLESLRLFHPYSMDVAVLYNLSGNRKCRSSLKTLSQIFLGETIQNSSKGHCSVQDAYATMKLLLLKLDKGIRFGNTQLGWSYNEHMKSIKIDFSAEVSDVRGEEPPSKMRKLQDDSTSVPLSDNSVSEISCLNCGAKFKLNCRNIFCVCRQLDRPNCSLCFSENSSDDEKETAPSGGDIFKRVFENCPGGVETVFDLFERRKKSFLWISRSLADDVCNRFCETARLVQRGSFRRHHSHAESNDDCVEKFRLKYMENDLNVLELSWEDNGSEELDSIFKKISQFSPSNSAICLVFMQNDRAVCRIKVKR